MESLRTESLSIQFGNLTAVKDVSLAVENGESRAIIGPNGAGKTTLFNLLTGRLHPSSGRIYLFGQDITALPLHQRVHLGLARTFQVTNLMVNLSVLDNVQLAVKAIMPFRSALFRPQNRYVELYHEAERLLSQWRLWERRNELVRDLSHGEQRLVELVMALASKPKILLLDEPTSGLSEAEASSFVSVIREAKKEGTLIIVEHHMDVVFDLAEYITVLHYGEVIAEGTKGEIKTNPKVKEVYLGEDT
jgi:branched-chain amino acid transport system ATP-binding protein